MSAAGFRLTDALSSVVPVLAVVEPDPVWRHEAVSAALQAAGIGDGERPLVTWSLTRQFEVKGAADGGGLYSREEGPAHLAHPGGALSMLLEWVTARTRGNGGSKPRFSRDSFQFGVIWLQDLGIFLSDPVVQRYVFDLYTVLSTAPASAVIPLGAPLSPEHPLYPIAVQVGVDEDPAARYGKLAMELVGTLRDAGVAGCDAAAGEETVQAVVETLSGLPLAHADAVSKALAVRVGRGELAGSVREALGALRRSLETRPAQAGG